MLEYRLPFDQVRQQVRGKDVELDDVLMGFHVAACMYVEELRLSFTSGRAGSGVDDTAEVPACSTVMSAQQVGDMVGITSRAVRLTADRDDLVGTKDEKNQWWFQPDDVAVWAAGRARRAAA